LKEIKEMENSENLDAEAEQEAENFFASPREVVAHAYDNDKHDKSDTAEKM